jgi:hypothetical protein
MTRALPNEKERDLHRTAFADYTATLLRHQGSELFDEKDEAEMAAATSKGGDTVLDVGPFKTKGQLQKHFAERVRMETMRPSTTFDYTVPTGSRIIGPPYDVDWSEGAGGVFSRFEGSCFTFSIEGFSASGVGFYLSSDEPMLTAITPVGNYDWNWFSLQDLPFLRSRGGLGVAIFADGGPQPVMSRQPVLWSLNGVLKFTGQSGSGRIADAASITTGFGPIRLAPALLNMVPGSSYLVWLWLWQIARSLKHTAVMASSKFEMPFVTIDAGPPIALR